MSQSAREIGDIRAELGDRYEIVRELGRGGMGAVYLARDLRLDRQVAIKVLPRSLATDAQLRERFLIETRTAASFSHPNIVPVHSVEERPELLAFVMGYIEGESLTERVKRNGPLAAREILRLLLDVGYALAYAHSRNVVHRDVKPDNVMIERATGRAMLMDFGISRSVAADRNAPGVTRIGEVVGTPEYMSPEQSVGDSVDGRSDLYSLALTVYFAAAGRPAFTGENTQKVLMKQLSEAPPPLAAARPDLPAVLTDAIERCLRKDPAERFEDAAELNAALEGAQSFAPDVPMPIRLFVAELAQLGMIFVFFWVVVWLLAMLQAEASDDVFIPIVLLIAIFTGRVAQSIGEARRILRQGFSSDDIRNGMRAVEAERNSRRIQLRADPATRRMRRITVWISVGMLISAVLLFNWALSFRHPQPQGGYAIALPGTVMLVSSLLQAGIAFILLARSPLSTPVSERAFRAVWLGPIGKAFFALAGLRLGASRPAVTAVRAVPSGIGRSPVSAASAPIAGSAAGSVDERMKALEQRVSALERQSSADGAAVFSRD